jgi:hypothetical protein
MPGEMREAIHDAHVTNCNYATKDQGSSPMQMLLPGDTSQKGLANRQGAILIELNPGQAMLDNRLQELNWTQSKIPAGTVLMVADVYLRSPGGQHQLIPKYILAECEDTGSWQVPRCAPLLVPLL